MRLISIDIGLNNFAAITNNIGKEPILIRGKIIKAENQWYNKMAQPIKTKLANTEDMKEKIRLNQSINTIAIKTIENIFDYFKAVSDWIIAYCIENQVDTVIVGQYKILEKENFVSIPFGHFYSLLETKCKYHNIRYTIVNERYTSGTSFFDNESPTRENYDKSRRIYKHLWKCNDGSLVNADVNDSYQIMRKIHPEFFEYGIEGFLKDPCVVHVKTRKGVEEYG